MQENIDPWFNLEHNLMTQPVGQTGILKIFTKEEKVITNIHIQIQYRLLRMKIQIISSLQQ